MIHPLDEDMERAIWRSRLLETLSSPALPTWLVADDEPADDSSDASLTQLAQRLRGFFRR